MCMHKADTEYRGIGNGDSCKNHPCLALRNGCTVTRCLVADRFTLLVMVHSFVSGLYDELVESSEMKSGSKLIFLHHVTNGHTSMAVFDEFSQPLRIYPFQNIGGLVLPQILKYFLKFHITIAEP